jgi:hypothetical protein
MDLHKLNISNPKNETKLICDLNLILDEINSLIVYVNECLLDISKTYKSVTYKISLPNNINDVITVFRNIDKK